MKRFSLALMLFLSAVILFAVACRQDAPDNETVTPPIVPAPAGEVDNGQAYPAPDSAARDSAYPAPGSGEDGGASQLTPETPTAGGTEVGDDAAGVEQPENAAPPVPIEPEVRSAEGTVQPLPEAGLIMQSSRAAMTANPGSTLQHTVSDGEWLLQIARCYGTSAAAIRNANNLANPDYLAPGRTLTVPDAGTVGPIIGPPCVVSHTVVEGETWDSIAQVYGTSPAILQRANPGTITVGRKLFVPATPIEASSNVPAITNHLLFINDGDLAIWRATDSQVEVVSDSDVTIVDLATNQDGRFVLARQTRDNGATSEVALIDTESRTSLVLESGMPPHSSSLDFVEQMLISTDGGWGVYASRSDSGYRLTSFQTAAPETLYVGPELPLDGPEDMSPYQLFPGQDSTRFLVSSARGLHEFPYSLDLTGRELVGLTGDIAVDPVANVFGLGWDPSGRYLMANGGFMEGGAVFIIDGDTGEMVQLPGSNGYVTAPGVSWAANGAALVIEPTAEGAFGPQLSSFIPTSEPELNLTPGTSTTLEITGDPKATPAQPGYVVLTPVYQPADGGLYLIIQGDSLEQGVWFAESDSTRLLALSAWPEQAYRAVWSRDWSGVVATEATDPLVPAVVTYVPLDGQELYELSGWLTGSISDFHWLVPR